MAHHFKEPLYGGLAQLGERLPCKQEVTGSIPVLSTKKRLTEATSKDVVSLSLLNEIRHCTLKTEHCKIMMHNYEKATVKDRNFNLG